jgi:lipopolysaccharide export system protein LptC
MRKTLILLSALLLPLQSQGQLATTATAADEFPALQLMPPGTVVEGISIPRYENHRVSALLLSDKMVVKDRQSVIMEKVAASLYSEEGTETHVEAGDVTYSFATKIARTTGKAAVNDPRFTARGKGVVFNTASRKGFLHGPVRTTIVTAKLNKKKGRKK